MNFPPPDITLQLAKAKQLVEQQEKDASLEKDDVFSITKKAKPAEAKKARIMLVDDEQDITAVMAIGLKNSGFEVEVFNDPAKALSHFEPNSYDLVILDIRMPRMSGFERYRELTKRGKVKAVFMSAFEMYLTEMEKVLPSIKADAVIKKPIKMSQLTAVIHRLLSTE